MNANAGVVAAFVLLATGHALAQNAPNAISTRPVIAQQSQQTGGAASFESPSASKETAADAVDRGLLDVEDPMLVPVPPPKKILADWRDAVNQVRTRSPNYLRAHAQVEAARGRARMVLARSLPTLTGNAQFGHHLLTRESGGSFIGPNGIPISTTRSLPAPPTTFSLSAQARIPVFSSRNWYDYSTSKREIERSQITLKDAERLIIGGLAEAIVTVVTAERLAEVTRVNLRAALSTLDLNRRRARLGSGNALDVLRTKQEVTRSRAQVVDADETLRESREALGQALGYSEPWGVKNDLKLDALRQDAQETCTRGEKIEDRADIRAARAGAAIAERNVKSVMYSYLPLIDLQSTLNHSFHDTLSFPPTTWSIGASLTWHLYEGGLRYGEKRTNDALLLQTQQDSLEIERNARIQVRQSERKVRVAKLSLDIAEESRSIAQDNAKLARVKFVNGTGTSFDMVDTQSTARQTELDVTVKEFRLLRAEIIAFLALASCDI